jgi:hypothetical protein
MPQRSLFWPVLGVAMVLIAGGALFLVWEQMQKTQPPAEIKITQERAPEIPLKQQEPKVELASQKDPPVGPENIQQKGSNDDKSRPPDHKKPAIKRDPVLGVFHDQLDSMKSCINEHPGDARSTFVVAGSVANGRAKNIMFKPAPLNSTPLAECLRTAIVAWQFPPSKVEQTFEIPLTPKRGP